MSGAFWAADSLAQSIEAAGARARANATLARQQQYHAADVLLKRTALAELERVDPTNPMLRLAVRERMTNVAERNFQTHGWEKTCLLEIDPRAVADQLEQERLAALKTAIREAQKEPIKERRRGWFFVNRRTLFTWRRLEFITQEGALAAKNAELERLQGSVLIDSTGRY